MNHIDWGFVVEIENHNGTLQIVSDERFKNKMTRSGYILTRNKIEMCLDIESILLMDFERRKIKRKQVV